MAELCIKMKPTKALLGDTIYREGDRAGSIYVIEEGSVELSRHALPISR